MRYSHLVAIAATVGGLVPGGAFAQNSVATTTTARAATVVFEADDFAHTTRSIVLTKLRRLLTFSDRKDAELTDAIANSLLLKAMEQEQEGSTEQADATLTKYQRESGLLSALVTELQRLTTDEATQTFLASFATDRAVQVAAIEATLTTNAGSRDIAGKLVAEQSKTLREIAKVLENETDPVKRDEKLADVFDHYSKKQGKLEAKLAKKLALAAKLDDETDDEELETELEQEEDGVIDDAAELDETTTDDLIAELDEIEPGRRAAVLTKLLAKVPDKAKLSIENAIDQLVKSELSSTSGGEAALKEFVDSHSDSTEVQDKVIDRLKEHADEKTKKKVEAVKKQVEQEREVTKKANEATEESEKKAVEQQSDQGNDTKDDASSDSTRGSSSSAEPSSSTPTTTEVVKETIEIKADEEGKFDKTSLSVKRGAQLTVKFKNESYTSRTLSLSNGKSVTVGRGETTIAAFSFDDTLTFTVTGVSGSGTISVK
jgi:hypothetical protein